VTDGDRSQVDTAAVPVVRQPDCHCGAGAGPRRPDQAAPKADVVLWLCPPCALEVTDPDQPQPPDKGRSR
jgi:hypothetical protein